VVKGTVASHRHVISLEGPVLVGSRLATFAIFAFFVGACGGTAATTPTGVRGFSWTPVADVSPFSGGTVQAAIAFGPGLVAP